MSSDSNELYTGGEANTAVLRLVIRIQAECTISCHTAVVSSFSVVPQEIAAPTMSDSHCELCSLGDPRFGRQDCDIGSKP